MARTSRVLGPSRSGGRDREAAAGRSGGEAVLAELAGCSDDALAELTRRIRDIDDSYRSVVRKMGQLYMRADEYNVTSLTALLDEPMRSSSAHAQTFAAILHQLRNPATRRTPGSSRFPAEPDS